MNFNTLFSGGLGRGGRITAWVVALGAFVRAECFVGFCHLPNGVDRSRILRVEFFRSPSHSLLLLTKNRPPSSFVLS